MTVKQLENKISDLQFWLDNNPKHPDQQHKKNLLLHYEFELQKLKELSA